MGRIHSAMHALERGMAVASGDDQGKMRFARATFLIGLGRLDEAEESFYGWMADLTQYPGLEPVYVGLVYYHLGLICRQQERFADSARFYATACEYLRRDNQCAHLGLALHNLAWVACLQGDEATALHALDEALPLCETPQLHWHQQIGRAFLLTVQRLPDLRMAMTLCEEIIDYKGEDLPQAVRSHAYWLAGRVALELSLRDAARVMAEQALLNAVGVDTDRCLKDAYRLMADVDSRLVPTDGRC
jgi:tetratricopeptide (TPR) repeat protein